MGICYNFSAQKNNNKRIAFAMHSDCVKLVEFGSYIYPNLMQTAALGFIIANPCCRVGYNYDWSNERENYDKAEEYISTHDKKSFRDKILNQRIANEYADKQIYIVNHDKKEYVDYTLCKKEGISADYRKINVICRLFNQDKPLDENRAHWYRDSVSAVFLKDDIADDYKDITEQFLD